MATLGASRPTLNAMVLEGSRRFGTCTTRAKKTRRKQLARVWLKDVSQILSKGMKEALEDMWFHESPQDIGYRIMLR